MGFYQLVFDEERPLRGLMFFLMFLLPFPFSYVLVENGFSRSSSDGLVIFWSVFLVLMVYAALAWMNKRFKGSGSGRGEVDRPEVG